MRLADLGGRRVALWGFGREGRATLAALRDLDDAPAEVVIVTDSPPADGEGDGSGAEWRHGDAGRDALRAAEVVVRSPGISRYRDDVTALAAAGVELTTATDLWFAEHEQEMVIGITGSKGKSTTSSLVAHLLQAAGRDAVLAGNIGIPLLGVTAAAPPDVWVVELSSQQIADLTHSPRVGVLLNLYREHLDWHGSMERYIADKLNLFGHRDDMVAILNAADPITLEQSIPAAETRWFNGEDGWHVSGGAIRRGTTEVLAAGAAPLRGAHNLLNLCAALTTVECAGVDGAEVARSVASFRPLRHRLETVATSSGIEYINDSIATIPEAAIAACEALKPQRITLLAGGFDRGQDYAALAAYVAASDHVTAVVTMPPSGERLHALLQERRVNTEMADDLADAVERARRLTPGGGIVLLSPAAPSYGLFRDFEARGDAFRELVS